MKLLSTLCNGETGIISQFIPPHKPIQAYGKQARAQHRLTAQRMRENGFTEGEKITMLQNEGAGPLVIRINTRQTVLVRSVAEQIVVQSPDKTGNRR
ncbi:MAG: ferrous iron transport protein A [Prosthecochloris sp.]|nr:ferrous iron transport protein A [Prosthecochloris sp.]